MTELIYHLAAASAWEAATGAGAYSGAEEDRADGFLHFSTKEQIAESAARHKAGRTDLVLLAVDVASLGDALKWEPSRGGALFPHLYGDVPLSAVRAAVPLKVGPDGRHVMPGFGEG